MSKIPLSLRNRNPGNLRPLPQGKFWEGQITTMEVPGQGFYCVFRTMELGARAAAKNILTYYRKHGLDTVRKIITRWAPADDANDTDGYISQVCKSMGVEPDSTINPSAHDVLPRLMLPIFRVEAGRKPDKTWWVPGEHLTDDQVRAGCELALRSK